MKQSINPSDLKNKIVMLVQQRREHDFCDFKEKHYDSNADLLHDILCMSNCLYNGNKYIILGVRDKTYEIVGISKEETNVKTQVEIIDFLNNANFAGDIRPEIALYTLCIEDKRIDVIIIFDKPQKPYFLSKDYNGKKNQNRNDKLVRAGAIYTRIGDKNTAISECADLYHIEKMWRQRFGLDLSIINRFREFIKKPQEWAHNTINQCLPHENDLVSHSRFPTYHKYFPEFQIELSESEEREGEGESFCSFYPNEKSYWGTAYFKYHTTTIFQIEYVYCDEMRILLPTPEIQNLFPDIFGCWFYYYVLNNKIGLFLKFLCGETIVINSRGGEPPILIFTNYNELNAFIEYASENKKSIVAAYSSENKLNRIDANKDFLIRINRCYQKWKRSLYKRSLVSAYDKTLYYVT